jgi:hypothetical protein
VINAEFVIENQKLSITSFEVVVVAVVVVVVVVSTFQQKLLTSSSPKGINS